MDISTYTVVGLALGSVPPLITVVIQQPRWSRTTRFWVGLAMAAAIGTATAFANGDLTRGLTWPTTIAAVSVAAQSTYRGLWAGGVVDRIETATSPSADKAERRAA